MGMDAADLEGAWGSLRQGDPIRELEEAWDDDDDVFDNDGADGVPSWSGFGGHMLMGEADHLPAGMDDLVEELMQAHSGRGLDSVVIRDGGRRRWGPRAECELSASSITSPGSEHNGVAAR